MSYDVQNIKKGPPIFAQLAAEHPYSNFTMGRTFPSKIARSYGGLIVR